MHFALDVKVNLSFVGVQLGKVGQAEINKYIISKSRVPRGRLDHRRRRRG